jgi:hypothetical protein
LSWHRLGCDVRDVHQYLVRPVHVEQLAAGTLPEAVARLARAMVRRLKLLARIPQGIFSLGPIPLIAPSLEIVLGPAR